MRLEMIRELDRLRFAYFPSRYEVMEGANRRYVGLDQGRQLRAFRRP